LPAGRSRDRDRFSHGSDVPYDYISQAQLTDFVAVKEEPFADGNPWCYGAPVGWIPPTSPEDWKPAEPKSEKGEPNVTFDDIDNPGKWSTYAFQSHFNQAKK